MINPLTLYWQITDLQKQVLAPLYTEHSRQNESHETLLYLTGSTVKEYKSFITDVCNSTFIKVCFKLLKKLGGADTLTMDDFNHFTNYVNDGGLDAMIKMLHAKDKEKVFVDELITLPQSIQDNAYDMLKKARYLHEDYICDYLNKKYKTINNTPSILLQRMRESNDFMDGLVELAKKEKQLDELIDEVERQ